MKVEGGHAHTRLGQTNPIDFCFGKAWPTKDIVNTWSSNLNPVSRGPEVKLRWGADHIPYPEQPANLGTPLGPPPKTTFLLGHTTFPDRNTDDPPAMICAAGGSIGLSWRKLAVRCAHDTRIAGQVPDRPLILRRAPYVKVEVDYREVST